jgi:hypothetical protein
MNALLHICVHPQPAAYRPIPRENLSQPSTRNPKPETRNPKPETLNPPRRREFLDAFRGAFEADKWGKREMPMVHLYAFSKEQDAMEDVMSRADRALGVAADRKSVECREVRLVAPGKHMVCCEFMLPRSIMATTDR